MRSTSYVSRNRISSRRILAVIGMPKEYRHAIFLPLPKPAWTLCCPSRIRLRVTAVLQRGPSPGSQTERAGTKVCQDIADGSSPRRQSEVQRPAISATRVGNCATGFPINFSNRFAVRGGSYCLRYLSVLLRPTYSHKSDLCWLMSVATWRRPCASDSCMSASTSIAGFSNRSRMRLSARMASDGSSSIVSARKSSAEIA